jgi:polysaccharide export outer membrane protein
LKNIHQEIIALPIGRWGVLAVVSLLALQNIGWGQTTTSIPPNSPESPSMCSGDSCPTGQKADDARGTLPQLQSVPSNGSLLQGPIRVEPTSEPNLTHSQLPSPAGESPTAPTEFQDFIFSSMGHKLPIYGISLFDHVPTTFAPIDRIPVTADYVIGPGDELLIRAWGGIDLDAKLMVDRTGDIYLPKVGSISLAGIKYEQVEDRLKSAVGRVFRNFDLSVNLGHLRSIQVFVVGQARRPGTYTVSSLSTLVNALFASGGPAPNGSMRHIQLKRNNNVVTEFDLYDLLLNGDKSKDARLLPGDVIYIPPVGPQVAVAGSVNVPAIYELRGRANAQALDARHNETSLGEVLALAGGLASTADGQKVSVERIENHTTRKVEEFALDKDGLARELSDGDLVRVFALSPRFDNAVTLRGNVARPGRYEWHPGMRIRDLIPDQSALITREYWREENSLTTVTELREYGHERSAPLIEGAPNSARSSTVSTDSSALEPRTEIKQRAPEINWDYAVIQRLNPEDLTARLISFDLGKAVLIKDEENNLALQPGDMITIFSQADLAVPLAKQTKFVRLEGELRAGVYEVNTGETLRQLVARAGGLTSKAYLYGAEFTRESVREEQQKGLDQMIQNLEQDITRNALTPTAGNPDDANEKRSELDAQRQLVDKLRRAKATGRIVLEMRPDSAGVDNLPDIALEDGDRLLVPYRPSSVAVLGAVYNKNSFLYRTDNRVGKYLQAAGGATRDADKGRIFVIRADGSVVSKQSVSGLWTGNFEGLRLAPGDSIIVPERLNRGATLRGIRDWTQIFSNFALGAAAVTVLK